MRLYAITDRRLLAGEHVRGRLSAAEREGLLMLAAQWAAAEVDWVQLREKDLPPEELVAVAHAMASEMQRSSTRLLVNGGRMANPAGVAGVHLPGGWNREQVTAAKQGGVVSVACHSVADVEAARDAQANIALLSPVFVTATHPDVKPLGLTALQDACRLAGELEVYALGGVSAENAAACMQAGATGVAGIRIFLDGGMHQQDHVGGTTWEAQ